MMELSRRCFEIVKEFEGFSAKPYICPAGYATIGYGHRIRNKDSYVSITKEQAEQILRYDLYKAANFVLRYTYIELNIKQLSSLVSFTYNVGRAAFQRSTLRQKINYGSFEAVESELMRWVYVKGKVLNGLIRRRKAEADLFYEAC